MTAQGGDSPALTAGARVRIVIEATVESLGSGELQLTGGTRIEYSDLPNIGLTVLEAGWRLGDIADDGYGPMVRVAREDGVHLWQRLSDGRSTWDDETSLASLRLISRSTGTEGER